ncbi:UDP-N-acetylglucosamine 4,6-dehydratase (inverting) [Litorivicinus sp.]|nr:UDP-N-acetylglucosamine 4,6-dehydratase (inverting) [Litorivicinus sp.]
MLNKKSILITGGSGSFGQAFAKKCLQLYPELKRLVIFSRDELKQYEMSCLEPFHNNPKVRFFLGDIRDLSRLHRALEEIDFVIHAAALKQVPAAEYNPFEFIKTNILGAQNLIEAVLDSNVTGVVSLSTDKAVAPVNLYGATKLASDKLFIAANSMKGKRKLKFSVVRYGNVMGSRGSVIPFFIKMKRKGVLPITDPEMTRFNISLDDGVTMALWACQNMQGGEIFVPKLPSYNIMDVANAICPECDKPVVGVRPGEKLHEEMITTSDAKYTMDLGKYYAILPSYFDRDQMESYIKAAKASRANLPNGYSSKDNGFFLSEDQLRQMINDYNIR